MPLVVKETIKLEHPTEPDVWVSVRLPLSGGNIERGPSVSDIVASAITEWSYDAPITGDTIRDLDPNSYNWLIGEVSKRAGFRTDDEKNASGEVSSPTSEPEKGSSRKSSGIS